MLSSTAISLINIFFGALRTVIYALLVYFSLQLVGGTPLKNYFKTTRARKFYLLFGALALAGAVFAPVNYIFDLLISFPFDFSSGWIPALVKFAQGLLFLGIVLFIGLKGVKGVKDVNEQDDADKQAVRSKRAYRAWLVPVVAILVIAALSGGAYLVLKHQGYIIRFQIFKPDILTYVNKDPQFSFYYSSRFDIDKDEKQRFGKDYLVGIKLPSDPRVGCDVRSVKGKINLTNDLQAVTDNLSKQISKGSKGFEVLESEFVEIGGREGIALNISFTGPLGETMRTRQVFTANNNLVYTLICGTTKDTYDFFANDFETFFESFSFSVEPL